MFTREDCGKWGVISVEHPRLVEGEWMYDNTSDKMFGKYEAPKQWLDQWLKDKFVKKKFNVCSSVIVRVEGWSASSSLADDDLDTGKFFCTGLRGEEWEVWPKHYYHLVFFDLMNMA